jgi:hypothetical protein
MLLTRPRCFARGRFWHRISFLHCCFFVALQRRPAVSLLS